MTKGWKIAAAAWLAVFVVLGDGAVRGAHAEGAERYGPAQRAYSCRYQSANERISWSRWEVRSTIACAAHQRGVSASYMLAIAQRESGLQPWQRNPSGACGLYQFMPLWWGSLPRLGGLHGVKAAPSCANARTSALAAARVMTHTTEPWQ